MNNSIRILCGVLAVILVGVSIIGSAGFIIRQSNMVLNKQIESTTQFQSLQQAKEIQKDLYSVKKAEIQRLQELQKQQQLDGQKAVESLPKDYITAKQNTRKAAQDKVANTQNQINAIQSELSNLTTSLQKPIDTKNIQFKSENGYVAIFELIANIINKADSFKDDPVTTDNLIIYFFIFVSAVFEVLAVTLYILDRKVLSAIAFMISLSFTFLLMTSTTFGIVAFILAGGMAFILDMSKVLLMKVAFGGTNIGDFSPAPPKNKIKVPESNSENNSKNDNVREIQNGRLKGLKFKQKEKIKLNEKPSNVFKFKGVRDNISNSDLQKYIKFMNENSVNGISPGYMKIAKNIGISAHKASKIKGYLEQKKVIESNGVETKILKVI